MLFAAVPFLLALTSATIDYTVYKATPTPSSLVLSFAKGSASRGFAWQTDSSVSEGAVWILEGSFGAGDDAAFMRDGRRFAATTKAVVTAVSGVNNAKINRHKAFVTGLRSATTYSYRLGGGGKFIYGNFSLNDVQDRVKILNLNDAQTKNMAQLFVWENTVARSVNLVGQPDFVLFGGDLYDENSPALKPAKYRQWAIGIDTATPYLPGIPWSFSQGNHDYTVYYDTTAIDYDRTVAIGTCTMGCQSFDYGRIHFATLPYLGGWNASNYGQVADWLDADLKAARASGKSDWLIVAMHWGVYVTGDHFVDVAGSMNLVELFAPIMSANHVDVVLQAHDHVYTKTVPYRWDAAGLTTTFANDAVVNLSPTAKTVNGETYDIDPNGTYYLSAGCAGHRVGDGNEKYANAEMGDAKCYRNCKYKIETGKINVNSVYREKGANASADLSAAMFGVLEINGDTLAYDWYAVATNGLERPVLFDTLRVRKTLSRAKAFSVTPYLQHPAKDAMSVIWFTKEQGTAKISWRKEGAAANEGEAMTSGVWAEALTNNLTETDNGAHGRQYRHRYRITGLEQATRYRYVVELDGLAYTNVLCTAPGKFSPVRLIYYNDPETEPGDKWTSDWTNPSTLQNRSYFVTKNVGYASNLVHMARSNPDLFVIAGDMASHGGLQQNWDEFWKHNAGALGVGYNDPAGSVPIVATIGNHDLQDRTPVPAKAKSGSSSGFKGTCEHGSGGEPALRRFLSYFEFNPNGVNYTIGDGETFLDYQMERSQLFHRLDYGPVSLIFLDTNNGTDTDFATGASYERDTNTGLFRDPSMAAKYDLPACRSPDFNPGSKQYCWLTNNLADARRKSKFTFVINHQCPYSVGYHNRTNITESGEWLSGRAVRVLGETMIRYGVDAWLCGHDEIMEHSRISGLEVKDDGSSAAKTVDIFDMGTAGDGLRGGTMTLESKLRSPARNPQEVWRADIDCPEVWKNGLLVSGGKHYGHMQIDVFKTNGVWTCTLTPVYVFVSKDSAGRPCKFERCVYNDVVTITEGGGFRVIVR